MTHSRTNQCTIASHARLTADVTAFLRRAIRPRAWTEADLYLGDCPQCRSTLAVPLAAAVAAGAL